MALKTQPAIVTNDRNGVFRVCAGVFLLAVGVAWLFSQTYPTDNRQSVLFIRNTAYGLAGMLCLSLPAPAILGGILLCASARRKISVRAYFILLIMYICLLGIVTLGTDVSDGRSLMAYILEALLRHQNSFALFLERSYFIRNHFSLQLPGGGVLGMLIAWPVYQVFGAIGGAAFLILAEIVLAFWLLRIHPLRIIQTLNERRYEKQCEREEERNLREKEAMAAAVPEPVVPENCLYDIQKPAEPSRRDTFTEIPPPLQAEVYTSPLQREEDHYAVPPDRNGFVPVQPGMYEEHIPFSQQTAPEMPEMEPSDVDDQKPGNRARGEKAVGEAKSAVRNSGRVSVKEMPETFTAEEQSAKESPKCRPEQPAASVSSKERRRRSGRNAQALEEQQEETPLQSPPVSHIREEGKPKPVYTDPAIPLTGEHIAITPRAETILSKIPLPKERADAGKQVVMHFGSYQRPPIDFLNLPVQHAVQDTRDADEQNARLLTHTLEAFRIPCTVEEIIHGPTVTRYAVRLSQGIKVESVINITENIALEMRTSGKVRASRIDSTPWVGIEVPNEKKSIVTLREVLDSPEMRANASPTTVALGKDIGGKPILCNLVNMPHLLIAGATGKGKSVCINSIITSILYRATPQQVRLILIDPKMIELNVYNDIPHLLAPVIFNARRAAVMLEWLTQEMDARYYKMMSIGAQNLNDYNTCVGTTEEQMPYIVVIIDEYNDLLCVNKKAMEENITRIAQKARAAGICIVMATQQPTTEVVTSVVKSNIPGRIAFAVTSQTNSRVVLDTGGAEMLLGNGDMLYAPSGVLPLRVQGCYVSGRYGEVGKITEYIRKNNSHVYSAEVMDYLNNAEKEEETAANTSVKGDDLTDNELLQRSIELAVECEHISISQIRRAFEVGHSRAGRIIDRMEKLGIVSGDEGPQARKTLITREQYAQNQAEYLDM